MSRGDCDEERKGQEEKTGETAVRRSGRGERNTGVGGSGRN